uniref:Fanconi anemia core complex-associated protein 100 n=1 Tax=Geotrypetes seraphini TaxID=260995 RepID=A0A6P8SGF3_GEOSA|nr:Fanconi anemia core complex-associated protein 100 [Geotrypetes seraphini]
MASCLQKVRYLAGFQCPVSGLSAGKHHVLCHGSEIYLSNCSKFLYVYNKEEKQGKAVYEFPDRVWHVQLVTPQQLYALCSHNGIYCVSMKQPGRSMKETDPVAEGDGFSPTVVTVDSDSLILQDSTISTFMVVGGFLVTVSKGQSRWRIKVLQNVNSSQENPKYSQIKQLEFIVGTTENMSFLPTLCCIFPQGADVASERGAGSHRTFTVKAALFSPLFGLDAVMLDSPVVLCGFPDGQVCFVPLKALSFPTVRYSCSDVKDQAPLGMILYHLEQPVVFIGALGAPQGASETGGHHRMAEDAVCDSIVVVGHQGKMLTVQLDANKEAQGPAFKEHHLPGPITCGLCTARSIYYSTPSDLFTFSTAIKQRTSDNSPGVLPFVLSPVSLNICGVVALSMPTETSEGATELSALSFKGRLMVCNLSRDDSKPQHSRMTSVQAGQKIKDLLAGIGSVSERVSLLKNTILQKNRSLSHLNQVINVSCALLSRQDLRRPIPCVITARWNRLLLQDSLLISCALENGTEYSLQQGWTLCVHVSSSSCAYIADSVASAVTHSFPIMNFLPKDTMEVSLPLTHERSARLVLPVTVSCSLFYSLKKILQKDVACLCSADSQTPHSLSVALLEKGGICLPLNECDIDALHCLRLHRDQDPRVPLPTAPSSLLPLDPVEIFLQSLLTQPERAGVSNEKDFQGPGTVYMQSLIASVRVSTELLEKALQELDAGSSLPCAVLQWLLANNTEVDTVKAQSLCEVLGTDPDGKDVHLRVTEVSIDEVCPSGPVQAVEIQIRSSSLAGISSAHQAVIRRLQRLVSPISCPPDVRLKHLQQLITDREMLLKEVQSLRDNVCLRKELGSGAAAAKLLDLYERLRNPGLLIL